MGDERDRQPTGRLHTVSEIRAAVARMIATPDPGLTVVGEAIRKSELRKLLDRIYVPAANPDEGTLVDLPEPTYPVTVRVTMLGKERCSKCHGPAVAVLKVHRTGCSFGPEHAHSAECPTLRCGHGVLWRETCPTCEAERDRVHAERDALRKLCCEVADAVEAVDDAASIVDELRDVGEGVGESPGGCAADCREVLAEVDVEYVKMIPLPLRLRLEVAVGESGVANESHT